jgi:hypothetical protein
MRHLIYLNIILSLVFLFISCHSIKSQATEQTPTTKIESKQEITSAKTVAHHVESADDIGVFDLLSSEGVTELTLRTNLDSLMIVRKKDEYIPGLMVYKKSKQEEMSIPVRIKCRGKYRRMICDFPPIKLKFRKKDLKKEGLNDFNELKVVTHCFDEKVKSKDLILREYLAYKLYQELTPLSFRAQLVRVNYHCTATDRVYNQWGIMLEDSEEVAHRAGGKIFEKMGTPPDSLVTEVERISSLFQYMISNTDWSIPLVRNIELVKRSDGKILTIPYDFDFSGLVSAPYSRANSDLGQKTVLDRVFLGNAKTYEELKPAINLFLSKKESMYAIIKDSDNIVKSSKRFMLAYLDEFFEIIKDKEKVETTLLSRAKNE